MTSTRGKNSPGNYVLEKEENRRIGVFMTQHESVGQTYMPGNGLLGASFPNTLLSANAVDIESQLYGIGSSNLESHLPSVTPDIRYLKSLSIADRNDVILPKELIITPNQRPLIR